MKSTRHLLQKGLYKRLVQILKVYPFVLSWLFLAGSLMTCFDIETKWMVLLCKTSFLSLVVLVLSSHVLEYCPRHRYPLYFIFTCNLVDLAHTYVGGRPSLYIGIYLLLFVLLYIGVTIHYYAEHCKKSFGTTAERH